MNTKKILLSVLICLVMVAVLCLGVACNRETKLDLLDAKWEPAEDGEEDIYRSSKDADGNLVIDFAKNDTYNYTRCALSIFSVKELTGIKTLVATAKMSTNAPYPALMFKVEGADENFAGQNVEVKVKITEDFTTYEWDFNGYDVTKITRILLFADPGVLGSEGKITIKEIYLTDKDVTPENDAKNKPADTAGAAPAPVWNEVTATNMAIGNWVDGTANKVYTATKNADNSYTVNVQKKIGAGTYDALISYVHGNALANMNSFKLVVKGTAGKRIIVKPFDQNKEEYPAMEKEVTLTGENQEILVNISAYTALTTNDYSKKDEPTKENKVVIIALPGASTGTDSFTIISAEFSTDTFVEVDTSIVNEITTTNHKVMDGWAEKDPGTYTVTKDGTSLKVDYDKNTWQALETYVKGAEIANMTSVKYTIKGTEGKTIMLKPFNQNSLETTKTLTGGEDVFTVDISGYVAGKTFDEKVLMAIIAEPSLEATGTFTIISVEFTTDVVVDETVNEITTENHKITKAWEGLDAGTFTVTEDGTALNVAYTTDKWVRTYVKGAEIANMKTLVFTVQGPEGLELVLKPFNAIEKKVVLTGEAQEVIIDIAAYVADKTFAVKEPVLIGVGLGVANQTGNFKLVNVEFSTAAAPAEPEPENPNLNTITNANKAIAKWYAESAYTIEVNNGAVTATVGKNDGWQQLKADVTGADIVNFALLKVKITGVQNVPFVVQAWDNTQYCYDGRPEGSPIPTGDEIVVEVAVPAGDYTATKTLIIFLNVNSQNLETCTVTITAEFGNPVNVITAENTAVTKWYGDSAYTFNYKNDGSVEVTKAKDASWAWFKADVSGADLANMKTFKIVLKGMNNNDIIVKPYDKVEGKREPATEDEITIIIDLTNVTGVDYNGTLTIIATFDFNAKVTEDTTFTIVSAEFSTEEAPAA